jgi:hypothetical protein
MILPSAESLSYQVSLPMDPITNFEDRVARKQGIGRKMSTQRHKPGNTTKNDYHPAQTREELACGLFSLRLSSTVRLPSIPLGAKGAAAVVSPSYQLTSMFRKRSAARRRIEPRHPGSGHIESSRNNDDSPKSTEFPNAARDVRPTSSITTRGKRRLCFLIQDGLQINRALSPDEGHEWP